MIEYLIIRLVEKVVPWGWAIFWKSILSASKCILFSKRPRCNFLKICMQCLLLLPLRGPQIFVTTYAYFWENVYFETFPFIYIRFKELKKIEKKIKHHQSKETFRHTVNMIFYIEFSIYRCNGPRENSFNFIWCMSWKLVCELFSFRWTIWDNRCV